MLESKRKIVKGLNIACIALAGLAFAGCLVYGIVTSADTNAFIQSDEPAEIAQGINNKAQDIEKGIEAYKQEMQNKENQNGQSDQAQSDQAQNNQSEQNNQSQNGNTDPTTPPEKPSGDQKGDMTPPDGSDGSMTPPDMPEGMEGFGGAKGGDDSILGKLFSGQGITTEDIAAFCNHNIGVMWAWLAAALVIDALMIVSSILVLTRLKRKDKGNFLLAWTIVGAAAALLGTMIICLALYIIALVQVCGIRKMLKLEKKIAENQASQVAPSAQIPLSGAPAPAQVSAPAAAPAPAEPAVPAPSPAEAKDTPEAKAAEAAPKPETQAAESAPAENESATDELAQAAPAPSVPAPNVPAPSVPAPSVPAPKVAAEEPKAKSETKTDNSGDEK